MNKSVFKKKVMKHVKAHVNGFRAELGRELTKAIKNDPNFVKTSGKVLKHILSKYDLKELGKTPIFKRINDKANTPKMKAGLPPVLYFIATRIGYKTVIAGVVATFVASMSYHKSKTKKNKAASAKFAKSTRYNKSVDRKLKELKAQTELEEIKNPVIINLLKNASNKNFIQELLYLKNDARTIGFEIRLRVKSTQDTNKITEALKKISGKKIKITLKEVKKTKKSTILVYGISKA